MSRKAQPLKPEETLHSSSTDRSPVPDQNVINLDTDDDQDIIIKTDIGEVVNTNTTMENLWAGIGSKEHAALQQIQKQRQEKEKENSSSSNPVNEFDILTEALNGVEKDNISLDSSNDQSQQNDNTASRKLARRKGAPTNKKGTATTKKRLSSNDVSNIASPISLSVSSHRPLAPNDGSLQPSISPFTPIAPSPLPQTQSQEEEEQSTVTVVTAIDETSTIDPSSQSQSRAQSREEATLDKDKPAVGTAEWHRQRKENHKQVERRRREAINDGINEIAKMVPGAERNKGSILQRAAAYIRQLKEAEAATIEKWTLEKLLTDQAINELNRQIDSLKSDLEKAKIEKAVLKKEVEILRFYQGKKKNGEDVSDADDVASPTVEGGAAQNGKTNKRRHTGEDEEEVMATVISALQQQQHRPEEEVDKCELKDGEPAVKKAKLGNDEVDETITATIIDLE